MRSRTANASFLAGATLTNCTTLMRHGEHPVGQRRSILPNRCDDQQAFLMVFDATPASCTALRFSIFARWRGFLRVDIYPTSLMAGRRPSGNAVGNCATRWFSRPASSKSAGELIVGRCPCRLRWTTNHGPSAGEQLFQLSLGEIVLGQHVVAQPQRQASTSTARPRRSAERAPRSAAPRVSASCRRAA